MISFILLCFLRVMKTVFIRFEKLIYSLFFRINLYKLGNNMIAFRPWNNHTIPCTAHSQVPYGLFPAVLDKNSCGPTKDVTSSCRSARAILCMCPANERRRYIVTSSLTGWAHTQNDLWGLQHFYVNVQSHMWVHNMQVCRNITTNSRSLN